MTYREKLIKEHPELDHEIILRTACPSEYMDVPCHPGCHTNEYVCDKCWNQEVPETLIDEKEFPIKNNEISCDSCIHSEVCKFRADFIKALDIAKGAPDMFEVIIRCKYNL